MNACCRRAAFPAAMLAWKAEELRRNGQTVILIAVDGQEAGLIGIARFDQGISGRRRCAI